MGKRIEEIKKTESIYLWTVVEREALGKDRNEEICWKMRSKKKKKQRDSEKNEKERLRGKERQK